MIYILLGKSLIGVLCNIFIDGKIMQDKYEYYPRPLIQTSQKVRKSRMSPGAGAGVEPDFKFLLEPEPKWSRFKNLARSATLENKSSLGTNLSRTADALSEGGSMTTTP